ncbi:uncharacterized protein LOC144664533 [Oculina patagonica]
MAENIVLDASKEAAVVKRDGIRKRSFPQGSTKHSLASPYHLQWPSLKNGCNKVIINEITRTLGPLQFERLCTKMRKAQEKKEKKEKLKQRSSLVLGVNEVTKALEKGTLKLVLVDRSIQPVSLLEHLLVLCATRKAPACAITGMNEATFPPLLGVRRVSAFAFKNTDTPTIFDALVDFITTRTEPLYVPWLHSKKEEGETPTAIIPDGGPAKDNDCDEDHLPGIQDMNKKIKTSDKIDDNQVKKHDSMNVKTATVNLQVAGDSAVNLPDTSNSQVTGDAVINKPGGKKRKRRSRKSSKTNQNGITGLEYLRPCVKSFDIARDKGNQAK